MINVNSHAALTTPDWRQEFKRLEGAYAPATLRAYYTDVQKFTDYCDVEGLQPFPADADTVCDFIVAQGVDLRPGSVRRCLYAIRKIHQLLRLPDPTADEDVNLAMRRLRRTKLGRPRQAKGMTRAHLEQCLAVQPDSPWGLRNRALLSLGYDLLTRRSELVALMTDDIEFRGDGTLRAIIRRGKTDPFGMGRIGFTSRRSAQLVGEWLVWRGGDIAPLFCGIYRGRAINRSLETTKVKLIVKEAVLAAGLPPEEVAAFSSHSLRVGAAQELLRAGFDTAAIMRAGGWRSTNVLARYLEYAEHNVWEARGT
jgi:site-specific recombinase XerD